MTTLSPTDRLIASLDNAMRTVFARHTAARPMPRAAGAVGGVGGGPARGEPGRRRWGSRLGGQHRGEGWGPALYDAQAFGARDPQLRAQLQAASRDETDHLAWTEQRLHELGGRVSWLNPLWYAGAFGIGLLAGRSGDATSLGFVVETERQVEQHLASHLDRLPVADVESRAVGAQMRDDEARHAPDPQTAGAAPLPAPVRWAMRGLASVMTRTAHYL